MRRAPTGAAKVRAIRYAQEVDCTNWCVLALLQRTAMSS
jgi:hypothetical protein